MRFEVAPETGLSTLLARFEVAGLMQQLSSSVPQKNILARSNHHFGTSFFMKLAGGERKPGADYMENWSLSLDIKIIFLTVWNMICGEKGAY